MPTNPIHSQQRLISSSAQSRVPTDRLFFALLPDPAAAKLLARRGAELAARCGLGGRVTAPSRLHVTLLHLGDFIGLPPGVVARACAGADSVQCPSLDVEFDRFMSFPLRARNQPFVLLVKSPNARLSGLSEALRGAMLQQGFSLRSEAFKPHITVCRDPRPIPCQLMEPVSWTAREFVLIRSLLRHTQYMTLARWPLSSS